MWLATTIGFYSAVKHRDREGMVLVRARAREDLERLSDVVRGARHGELGPIEDTPLADYPYRIAMRAETWASIVRALAERVDYDNFKSAVGNLDRERAQVYHRAWAALLGIERAQPWAGAAIGYPPRRARSQATLIDLDGDVYGLPARVNAGLASPAIDLDDECPGCHGFRWVGGGRACEVCNSDGDTYPF